MASPNIILIILDCFRADKIFTKFNNIFLTPNMAQLLKNSIYFKNCIANSPWTIPSHISIFTGLYPSQNKFYNTDINILNKKIPVLPEILKNLGYHTLFYSENPFISIKTGFTRGFDIILKDPLTFEENFFYKNNILKKFQSFLKILDISIRKYLKNSISKNIWYELKIRIEKYFLKLIRSLCWRNLLLNFKDDTLLELNKIKELFKIKKINDPIFCFFNIMATHYPYIPKKELFNIFGISNMDFKFMKKFFFKTKKFIENSNIKNLPLSPKKTASLIKLYNSCVFYSDLIVKKIIYLFNELKKLENTYVIITSDHGEHLCNKFDHYLWGHHTYLSVYNPLIRVPLIIYNKNFSKSIIDEQVQLKDLFHTILHLTGIVKNNLNSFLKLENSILYQIENNTTPKYIYGEYLKQKKGKEIIINRAIKYKNVLSSRLIEKLINDICFIKSK
ncbi:MAG: sulfatase-like hydrolase/transferase, partial [Promethearchaeota archaeon]